ncbi:MAG: Ig-like domain repeat protein, partial [Clostridiales Family XIII bacterium]|nr:Ig-like domain repeat protein [Clostridiales Family XIII bacterium]
ITYNSILPDIGNPDFYRETRIATVTITERNFNPDRFDPGTDDLHRTITNPDSGVIPGFNAWNHNVGAHRRDADTHSFTVVFDRDGKYTLDVQYKDLAGNKAEGRNNYFVIDKTYPVVSVSYDNNSARTIDGADYYKDPRIATITVNEHNFDPGRVDFSAVNTRHDEADDASRMPALPRTWGDWRANGDTYTATVNFNDVDAFYHFDVTVTDRAGNTETQDNSADFYVDQESPKIQFEGDVQNETAFRAEVRPIILFSDTNLYESDITLELSAVSAGAIGTLKGGGAGIGGFAGRYEYDAPNNSQSFVFDDFPSGTDDVYTLRASIMDKAGNESEDTDQIVFSVNRNGSNFIIDDAAKDLVAYGYTNKTIPVTITEINASDLAASEITHSKAGSPTVLTNGTDYTEQKPESNWGTWSKTVYTVNANQFAYEVDHELRVESTDIAGNENNSERNGALVDFIYDVTIPDVSVKDFETKSAGSVDIEAIISDDRRLHDTEPFTIQIHDGDEVRTLTESTDGSYEDGAHYAVVNSDSNNMEVTVKFRMNESANRQYYFTVDAEDKATNALDEESIYNSYVAKGAYMVVNDNPLVRLWLSNPPLVAGVGIAILLIIAGGILWFIMSRRRRDEEEDTNAAV